MHDRRPPMSADADRVSAERRLRVAAAALGADGGFVVAAGPEAPRIVAVVGGPAADADHLAASLLELLAGGAPLVVPAAGAHPGVRDASPVRDGRVGALVARPLRDPAGRVAAAFCLWRSEPHPWAPAHLALLDDLETVIGDGGELRAVRAALQRTREHLLHAQKLQAVGRLASGMAHDFNNLLTAIMGFGELILEWMPADAPTRGDAEEVVRSARRGRDLTDQLLSFSRRRPAEATVLDLNEVVVSSRRLVQRLMEERVRLETRLSPDAGPVRIDRTELEQIIVNLAVNARDSVRGPDGVVRIETGHVDLELALDAEPEAIPPGRWETLAVTDNGAGMEVGLRLRIFEPFFTTKPVGEGTGLGLSTVYGIVKRVGGFVRLDSRPGQGTTFTVYLPPTAEAPQAPEARAPQAVRGSEAVLLVEDQAQIRSLLARQLRRSGFEVVEAGNGQEALALWKADPDAFDIVVSDVIMPVMDGPTMVALARALRPDLPVVFVSGYPGAADPAEREVPLPEAPLLRKPFAAAELVAAIRATLDR